MASGRTGELRHGRLHRDRPLAEIGLVEPDIHEHRLPGASDLPRALECHGNLRILGDENTPGAEAFRDFVVVGASKDSTDIVLQHLYLLARDLCPARIITYHGDHRNTVADERVEFNQSIAAGTVPVDDPDLASWASDSGAEREPGADAERAEHAGVEPAERAARAHDVGGGRDEVAPVRDHDRVVARGAVERAKEAYRVDEFALRRRLRVDLGLAPEVAFA